MKQNFLKQEINRTISIPFDYNDVKRRIDFSAYTSEDVRVSYTPRKKVLATTLSCLALAAVIVPVSVYYSLNSPVQPDYYPPDELVRIYPIIDGEGRELGSLGYNQCYLDGDDVILTLLLGKREITEIYFTTENATKISVRYSDITAVEEDGLFRLPLPEDTKEIYVDFRYSAEVLADILKENYLFIGYFSGGDSVRVDNANDESKAEYIASLIKKLHSYSYYDGYLFNISYGVSADSLEPMDILVRETSIDTKMTINYTAKTIDEALNLLNLPSTLILNNYGMNELLADKIRCYSQDYTELRYYYGINANIDIRRFIGYNHGFNSQSKYKVFTEYLLYKFCTSDTQQYSASTPFAVGKDYTATIYTYFKPDGQQFVIITPNNGDDEFYIIRLALYNGVPEFSPDVIDTEELIKNMVLYEFSFVE